MHRGYIYIWRKILDSEWYQDSNAIRLYFHCVLKANFIDKKWQGIDVEKGSFITSIDKLKSELGLTSQNVRTSLKKLEKSKNITIRTTNKFTVITVCNYDSYQDKSTYTNKQTNSPLTINQQSTNNQLTTTNNSNNSNNLNNLKDIDKKSSKKASKPKSKIKTFKTINKDEFIESVRNSKKDLQDALIFEFIDYWSEMDDKNKMRFQLQKTWSIESRLRKWKSNNEKWGNNKNGNQNGGFKNASEKKTDALKKWQKMQGISEEPKSEDGLFRDVKTNQLKLTGN